MANRSKEDEKIEKAIRTLVKLPENKRCINCKSLGPQYVCTTFWTFVCTNCSGVHREFTHRVKSVSMAKFTPDEVSALQAGGNEKARQVFFENWDSVRNSYPESSNIPKIRNFIKHVYIDRRYTGERKGDQNLTPILNDKEESRERRNISSLSFGTINPDERIYARSFSERSSPIGNSDEKSFRYSNGQTVSPRIPRRGGSIRSSPKFEIVDDRFRDEECGGRRRSNVERSSPLNVRNNGQGSQSPVARHSVEMSVEKNVAKTPSSPTVRPVADIIGENSLPLQMEDTTQSKEKGAEVSLTDQANVAERKAPENIIDLSDNFQTPDSAAASLTQPFPQSNHENNWALFEFSGTGKAAQASTINSLEALLFELAGPSTSPTVHKPEVPCQNGAPKAKKTNIFSATGISPSGTLRQMDSPRQGPDALTVGSRTTSAPEQLSDGIRVQPELRSPVDYNKITNERWASSSFPNSQGTSGSPWEVCPQAPCTLAQDPSSGVETHRSSPETKSNGRKELSAELFSMSYSSAPIQMGGWQNIQPKGLRFGMQHYPRAAAPAYPTTANSTNPFEITDEGTQGQFPTLSSLQGAPPGSTIPNVGFWHASDFGNARYPPPMSRPPQFAPALPISGTFMEQVKSHAPPNRPEGLGSSGSGDIFSSLNLIQQQGVSYVPPTTSSKGGNPFA